MKRQTGVPRWSVFVGIAALALSACATLSPQEKSAYDDAQAQVQQAQADPLVNQAAGKQLQDARDALSNAGAAVQRHNAADVMYWSYLATHRAQTAEAMAQELRDRNAVASATAERDRVLLEAQRQRADLAQQQAQQAQQQAQGAEQQLQQQRQQQQAQQAQQQVQAAQQQEQQAKQQLQALQAQQTERGMVLTLSGSLLFATGHDTLEPGALRSLQNVAAFMQRYPMVKIHVEGFTDDRGSDALNDALSQRRAQAVAAALESDDVDPSRVEPIGRGKSLPVASNETSAGRQQNRRVELVFSDTAGTFAGNQVIEQLR